MYFPLNNRIALGTVQFGLPYGIAIQAGQVSRNEAAAILEHAWAIGLDTLDTAIAYGESEQRLGEIGVAQWQVISKIPAMPAECTDIFGWMQKSVTGSLARLKISHLRGLLLHRPQQLLETQGEAIYAALVALKDQGLVEKIGISIYGPEELSAIWSRFRLDLVQAPFNIVDRRLATSGWLKRLHQAGTEVHVRSVFLQGLLLMDSAKRPEIFKRWQPLWDQWHRWLDEQALTPLQACLGFAGAQSEIGRMVVGVDSLKHLKEIISAASVPVIEPPTTLIREDRDLVDPTQWDLR